MNIIHFVTHDSGRFFGCYGRPIGFSPNIDRFAAESVRFNQAFCSAPCCGPSRVCTMTGQYSHVNGSLGLGSMGWPIPLEKQTLVDHLNGAGYQTAHVGFCHERLYGEMRYEIDGKAGEDESYWNCDARNVADKAIEFFGSRDKSRPFYLNLATNETHAGHLRGSPKLRKRHGDPVDRDLSWVPPTEPDTPETRARWANFYASLQYVDHHFGRILEAVDAHGLRDDTLVVFTTDHGTGCQRGKRHVYQPGTEIALLVRPPKGCRTGYTVDHLIGNIDYFPTLLEAAGAVDRIPGDINGRSFWPLLAGKEYSPHPHIFVERNYHGEKMPDETEYADKYDPQRSIRTRDFVYIRHFRPQARSQPWYREEIDTFDLNPNLGFEGCEPLPLENRERPDVELYDLRHDPWEQHNVAGRGEYADTETRLAAQLDQWMRETNDPAFQPGLPPPIMDPAHWPTRGSVIELERR